MKKYLLVAAFLVLAANTYAEDEKALGSGDALKKVIDAVIRPIEGAMAPATELGRIVVTPSRMEEKLGSASSSISVIDYNIIERKKIYTAGEALKDEVGIDIRQSGAFQGTTSLLMRGGNSNQTLILIDGMKAYDPVSINGSYDLSHLTLDNVERIEVLRGPQSALYGSDAMAGVVSVITEKALDTYVEASWEGGSFFTYLEQFKAGSVARGFHYSIAGSRLDTKGISQAQAKKDCQERDPYDRMNFSGRVDYDISDTMAVGSTLRYTKGHYRYDQGANTDDDNAFSDFRETFITLYGDHKVFDWWRYSVRLGWMETIRCYSDDDLPIMFDYDRSKYSGEYYKFDYQNEFTLFSFDKIVVGYEYTNEGAKYQSQNDYSGGMVIDTMPEVSSRENGLYLENRLNLSDRLTSTQGMRLTGHSRAGTNVTYRLDGSYLFPTGTKMRGLIATGFKAPSLFQLFAPSNAYFGGGNANLQAEESQSYEYGIDQYLCGEKAIIGVTYFHTLYRNLIDALMDPNTFFTNQYTNIGKSQVHGIEAQVTLKPVDTVRFTIGLTYQKTKDFQNDQDMIRRPERKVFVECFWQVIDRLSVDLRLRYNGPMSDNLSNPLWGLDTYKVKEFTVVDAVINYDISKNFSAYVKMNNIFNKYYEEVRGYTTVPFAAYGGVKAKF
jgi:vitamin B12 transporter